MPLSESGPFELLEKWSTPAFIIAGGLFFVNAILTGLGRYTAILETGFLNVVIFTSAMVISLVGLLGFYPRLVERLPRLARISAGVVVVAGGAMVALVLWATTSTVLNRPMPPGLLLIGLIAAIVLGYVLFGIASLRSRTPSRLVGGLLLTFVAAWAIALGIGVMTGFDTPDWLPMSLNGASALVLLAIGHDLRTGSAPTKREKPSPGSTAK